MYLRFLRTAVATVALLGFASTADAAYILKATPGTIAVGETTVVTLNGDTTITSPGVGTTGIIGGQITFNFDGAFVGFEDGSALLGFPLRMAGGSIDFVDVSPNKVVVTFSILTPVIAIDDPDDILSVSFTGVAEAPGGTIVSVSAGDGSLIQFENPSLVPNDLLAPVTASVGILVMGNGVPVPIPVPATLALFGAALAGLGCASRRLV